MKILSLRRLLGMAAVYGAAKYVRSQGGIKNALDDLQGRAKKLMDQSGAKPADASLATNTGRGPKSFESEKRSAYASYDLDSDDKLRH